MIVAIDPGQTGAVAHLHNDGRFCCVHDMPVVDKRVSAYLLAELVRRLKNESGEECTFIVEKVAAMPKQGVSSTFTFGQGYGIVLGVLAALRCRLGLVRPAEWKRKMGLSAEKEPCRQKALELFPDAVQMLQRKKDHGRAEALLLGFWYARRLQVQHDPEERTAG